ncbi:MAG: OmpW family outer membrane protein [Thermoanaerobaculia bacterium]|nr:OmpW family outer membrane protein [Thermoanaerobaculia bacterium]
MSRWKILAIAIGVAVALPAGPTRATAAEPKLTLRGCAVHVEPTGDDLAGLLPGGEPFAFRVEGGLGAGLEAEYRIRPRLGIELAALAADLDAELVTAPGGQVLRDTESAAFELFSAGVNYHRPVGGFDLHVGAFAAIVYFDDVVFLTEVGRSDKLVFDDDTGFGIKLGLDRAIGASGRWLVSLSTRYLGAILEGETAGQDTDLDPLIVSLGIAYRF